VEAHSLTKGWDIMPEIINIEIIEKHATTLGAPVIVCGNSGYSVEFSFDDEWEGLDNKTARFVYVCNGVTMAEEVEFTGSTVDVPVLINTREVLVGVYTDTLCTSTPALIPCELSIRCFAAAPYTPSPSPGGGGGVPDYNDLPNKPFTYLEHAALDELIEKGMFVCDSYSWYENGEYSGSHQNQAIIINTRLPYGNVITQTVWICSGYKVRNYQNGVWSAMQEGTYQMGSGFEQIFNIPDMGETPHEITLDTDRKYMGEINRDCTFILPNVAPLEVAPGVPVWGDNSILVNAHITQAVSIDWGADVLFYDGQVPVIEPGYYDIIFTFDPNAEKWCVGVICKGAAE
jgi:hypothetical protein